MPALDPMIHQPVRLRIMASLVALGPGDQVDFTWLRGRLGLTDGNLGAHLQKLETVRYIKISKRFVARKPKTYVSLTSRGRVAFEEHVAALREVIGDE